ncbi:MAG: type II toxin-antitoxin system RelE/ParE family toxin [Methanospirillum sp.]
MPYVVDFSEDAEDDLKRLPNDVAQRIKDKIFFLETVSNPRKYLDKVEGKYNGRVYRYRIGDFRAYLTFKDEVLVIVVIQVGLRKNIYKR